MGEAVAASFKEMPPDKHLTEAYIFISMKNSFIQWPLQSKDLLLLLVCVLSEGRNRISSGLS
jgi:hypothetical protein